MLGHPRLPPGEFHEGIYLHRALVPGVAELGLWRRSFGNALASTVHAVHTDDTNNTIGLVSGDYASIHGDWSGEHAAICGDGSSFRRHHEGHEQFGGVEFVGCNHCINQRRRAGQRCCGRHGHDQREIGNGSRIGNACRDCSSRGSEVDHDISYGLVHTGSYQPTIHGDRRLQRRQQF
jgi:hypothetical protein